MGPAASGVNDPQCPMLMRRVCCTLMVAVGLACADRSPAPSRFSYPAARTVNVVDDYHGTKVPDPYRWLEDLSADEVRTWAAAQTALAESLLRKNDVHPWLLARMEALGKVWDAFSDATREKPLIDGSALGAGKSVEGTWLSPDRKLVAYAVSDAGSEWLETRIRRQADDQDLPDRLDGWLWSDALWTKDSRGFFYVRSVRPPAGERTAMKSPGVYYHVAGTPQSADVPIFRTPPGTTDLVVTHQLSDDGRYLFFDEGNGAHLDGLGWTFARLHVLDLVDPVRPRLTGTPVALTTERDAAYRVLASDKDVLYVFTDRGAPRRRLVAIDLKQPSPDRWRNVIPQSDLVIDAIHVVGGRFATVDLRDVQYGVRVFNRDGLPVRQLAIPPMSRVMAVKSGAGPDEVLVDVMGFFSPPVRTLHHLRTGAVSANGIPELAFNPADFEVNQVWYASKDGTRVPMFLAHRRGLSRDKSHPAVLVGYGASGTVMGPGYAENVIASLEMGMVVAVPALRGGGEFGRAWHDAATLERKQNTFDDFIAAADYLIAEGYTRADRLAIVGASNGGLLVTAVITQRPELFRVAVAEVPMSDALRYNRGRHNPQFGTAANPAHFPFLYAYSPQHRISSGTCYPSTLLTTALNDDRAPAWMALKFTAALQAAQSCDRPVILRADPGGGHGGNFLSDASDALSFIAVELGVKVPGAR
jgi:prolyl oligopeptidase